MVHKLLGDEFGRQREELRQRLLVLFPQESVRPMLSQEGFSALLSLVGRNGQGVATSPYSQWVKKVSFILEIYKLNYLIGKYTLRYLSSNRIFLNISIFTFLQLLMYRYSEMLILV